MQPAQVECRSEHSYAQRPVAVWRAGERVEIEAVEAEWRTPTGKTFRVRCAGGWVTTLTYNEAEDRWFYDR